MRCWESFSFHETCPNHQRRVSSKASSGAERARWTGRNYVSTFFDRHIIHMITFRLNQTFYSSNLKLKLLYNTLLGCRNPESLLSFVDIKDIYFGAVGEGSGKPNRTVAKHIPGPPGGLDQLGARASTAAGEISRAHMLVVERGDKLSQLEDRTERMHNEAAQFSSSAHQLMLKYKDKKWYQL